MPGFRNADVYPLERPNLAKAQELARGNLRGGRVVMYTADSPLPRAFAQLVRRQLAEIGLDVEVRALLLHTASAGYFKLATPGEQWDLALGLWQPSYVDPYAYLNQLLDGRYAGGTNFTRFNSRAYNQQMRRTASVLQNSERRRAYGTLDVRLARGRAVGRSRFPQGTDLGLEACRLHRPAALLDLTAVCLK